MIHISTSFCHSYNSYSTSKILFLEQTQEVLDTQKLVLEEVNVMKDQSKEPAIAIAGEMEVVPEKEVYQILWPRTCELF